MWRRLRDGQFDIDLVQTYEIVPTVSTVRGWLTLHYATSKMA